MNKFELIGKFATYAILGGVGMIVALIGYLELYEQSGYLIASMFFMINIYLMVRGIAIIVDGEQ